MLELVLFWNRATHWRVSLEGFLPWLNALKVKYALPTNPGARNDCIPFRGFVQPPNPPYFLTSSFVTDVDAVSVGSVGRCNFAVHVRYFVRVPLVSLVVALIARIGKSTRVVHTLPQIMICHRLHWTVQCCTQWGTGRQVPRDTFVVAVVSSHTLIQVATKKDTSKIFGVFWATARSNRWQSFGLDF